MKMRENMLSGRELCDRLGVTWRTIYNWRERGMPYIRLQGGVKPPIRYDLKAVRSWLNENINRSY